MEITAWVAVAVLLMSTGQQFIAADEVQLFKTEADCQARQLAAAPEIEKLPTPIAYGLGCAKVVISDHGSLDPDAPPKKTEPSKPPKPKVDDDVRGIDGRQYL